ncbi:hypothetical protein [Simplicispira psychrophila]|uniref:hypothetical protein n=1 Tax=Simplicispira psychrophila TaxID=80882 RepID=UPI000689A00D|nr:hypothetical protein [Simplicispira psychrophila]
MAHSNLLGGDPLPAQPSGTDTESLGTSDNSDSGSDVVGALSRAELRSDTDSTGTGESADVERDDAASASDIRPDHLLRSAQDRGDGAALDRFERTALLDDAREQIDTLASDDDAAPGDAAGQDAGDGD